MIEHVYIHYDFMCMSWNKSGRFSPFRLLSFNFLPKYVHLKHDMLPNQYIDRSLRSHFRKKIGLICFIFLNLVRPLNVLMRFVQKIFKIIVRLDLVKQWKYQIIYVICEYKMGFKFESRSIGIWKLKYVLH